MNYRIGLVFIGLAAIFTSCHAGMEPPLKERTYTFFAGFEEDATRVSLEQTESSLDLVARWQEGDEVKVLVYGSKNYLELPAVPVIGISEDGKDCRFTFSIPDDFEVPETGYRLICYTIPPGSDDLKKPKEQKETAALDLPILRYPLEQFRAPVLYDGHVEENNSIIAFHHLYTYELLHVENKSNDPIIFTLNGFSATTWWFKLEDTLKMAEDWFESGGGGAGGGGSSYGGDDGGGGGHGGGAWAPPLKTKLTVEPVRESAPTTIAPNAEVIIVSAYLPNGAKIQDAQMVAVIDGKTVTSSNSLSSDVDLKTGHAYHMYAVWDGTELRFVSHSFGEPGSSEVDAGGSGFGSSGEGNISGSGLGYGTDSSGNITGGGSGYGTDGSGALSGGGSGYSKGN